LNALTLTSNTQLISHSYYALKAVARGPMLGVKVKA
jgi:hypothetical protein